MSSKQLLRLAALLAAVLVLWGAVALASRRSDRSSRPSILPQIDTASVDTISLIAPGDTALLTRGGKGSTGWQANGHPADSQAVNELLRALGERDRSAEVVARNPASHPRLGVSSDSGKRVRIVSRGKPAIEVLAGRQASNGEGVYLRRLSEPDVYVVSGELANALVRRGEGWRDHTIASVVPDSVGRIEIARGRRAYSVQRKGTAWVFGSGQPADSSAVNQLLGAYHKLEASGFGGKPQQDSLRFDRGHRTAKLLDRKGAPLLSLAFDSLKSGIWVRAGSTEQGGAAAEAYRLDSWTADRLTPPDSTLKKR